METSYWREHHKRAAKEARLALWDQSRKRTVIAVLVWAVALALVWLFGDQEDVRSEIIFSLGVTVALGLVFPAVYAWEFVALIPKRAAEADALIEGANLKPLDLAKWTNLDPLELGHVAFLWCNKTPRGSARKADDDVSFLFQRLRRAIFDEELAPAFEGLQLAIFRMEIQGKKGGMSGPVPPEKFLGETTPVSVAELRRYAKAKGEKPLFLFPPKA